MKPGDIIVYFPRKSASWISRALAWYQPRFGQGGLKSLPSASHCSILAEDITYEYESTTPRSRFHKISEQDKENFDIIVYEFQGITDDQRSVIIKDCEKHLGELYDYLELFFGLINLRSFDACSEWVKKRYLAAGLHLGNPKEYLLSPNELVYETKELIYIGKYGSNS